MTKGNNTGQVTRDVFTSFYEQIKDNSPSLEAIKLKHANATDVAKIVREVFLNTSSGKESPKHDIRIAAEDRSDSLMPDTRVFF